MVQILSTTQNQRNDLRAKRAGGGRCIYQKRLSIRTKRREILPEFLRRASRE